MIVLRVCLAHLERKEKLVGRDYLEIRYVNHTITMYVLNLAVAGCSSMWYNCII